MNQELKTILGDKITITRSSKTVDIPVAHIKYKGSSRTYITWTIIKNSPLLWANDTDLYSEYQVDIDIYSDGNYLDIEEYIKNLMKTNEFVWMEDSSEMFEEDTELYHKTCTFGKERMI